MDVLFASVLEHMEGVALWDIEEGALLLYTGTWFLLKVQICFGVQSVT